MQSQPSSPSTATGEPQQDPELWFEDGNVVIVAGSASFRVHTGVLSRHSEIFQDMFMFSVPQPALPAPSDVLDGRPVPVHVSDSAHDFKQPLRLLYYDGVKFMPPDQPVAFSALAAVMRLGHKYHIEWILEGGNRRPRSIFTSSYDVWSRNRGSSSHLVNISSYSPWIEAVNLIQLIGATSQCCRQSPSVLFKGAAHARALTG